ncbi:hypothetical protein SASPL_124998 [Salvia splendens]|uniref:BSD domain-containing protein n=1 Tax=Salvia splendens TaxID=180675 RepID=A0A8X8ZNT9_SALSN|nr:hypothetical protein SASPL_124998 [Salvia splendens]
MTPRSVEDASLTVLVNNKEIFFSFLDLEIRLVNNRKVSSSLRILYPIDKTSFFFFAPGSGTEIDDSGESDVPMVSNIRQDLTEWQEKHAKLVLLTVKEVSKLRYQLCPRVMKERKFWRIFFILVKAILLRKYLIIQSGSFGYLGESLGSCLN